ncbi:MAG: hypothetical protein JO301_08315 [Chitinophagaceae bacterium]|nr:hypothetical protein [Chitinophagaceae bacterium]
MQNSFNLVQAGAVIQQRWKTIAAITVITALVAAITVFLVPRYFRSTATVVSANPLLADKARLFNNNIQGLYSYFGSGDDLDRITGIADMDTTYKKLVDEFGLIDYYRLSGDSISLLRRKAVLKLRKDLSFQRTDQGQLKIVVWTKQQQLSANIVNRMVSLITETETAIWQNSYSQSLSQLDATIADMQQQYRQLADSMPSMNGAAHELAAVRQQTLLEQLKQYQKAADEFRLAAQTRPAALYVLEPATPAAKAERPAKLEIILAAAAAGFVFACFLLLLNNRNRSV